MHTLRLLDFKASESAGELLSQAPLKASFVCFLLIRSPEDPDKHMTNTLTILEILPLCLR